jgi:hypothetical protein
MELIAIIFMAAFGHATHLIKKTAERRADGWDGGVLHLVEERPYRTVLGVCGSVAALAFLFETGQVSLVAAFAVGYMADSALGLLDSHTGGKFR